MTYSQPGDVRPRVVAESRVDYKYRRITEKLDIEYEQLEFVGLCRSLIKRGQQRPTVLHLRYLKWRGFVGTLVRYGVLLVLARLTGVRIVWSAHNVREYSIPSASYNRILSDLVGRASQAIIVFDRALSEQVRVPPEKVRVATFGEYRSFYEQEGESDNEFRAASVAWLNGYDRDGFDLISVGVYAPSKRVESLLQIAEDNPDLTVLVVAPGMPRVRVAENVFLWTSWVREALVPVFEAGRPVGFLGHSNVSVPTTVYVYASFGIPILVLDAVPVSSIVREHHLGAVSDSDCPDSARAAFDAIQAGYDTHAAATRRFLRHHSWERSALVHEKVFARP